MSRPHSSSGSHAVSRSANAFTVDLEDWYHGIELPFEAWGRYPERLEIGLWRVLDLLDAHDVQGTFFTLGWIAEKHPAVVKEVAARGHELGSHGFSHEKVYNLTPDEFRLEVRRTKRAIEDLTGQPVVTHRSPFFTITPQSLWALDILGDEGYTIDCSISPVKTWRYGIANSPDEIYHIADRGITEFPVSTFNIFRKRWAIGGAYFRILPYPLTKRAFRRRQAQGKYTMFYIHPWEYDAEHPVAEMERKAKLTHYARLGKTHPYTNLLLRDFAFSTVSQVVANYAASHRIRSIHSALLEN